MRKLTVEPNGAVAVHSHKDRPAVLYILEGKLTDMRVGGASKEHGPGDLVAEGNDVTHWVENKGSTRLVFIVADIFKTP